MTTRAAATPYCRRWAARAVLFSSAYRNATVNDTTGGPGFGAGATGAGGSARPGATSPARPVRAITAVGKNLGTRRLGTMVRGRPAEPPRLPRDRGYTVFGMYRPDRASPSNYSDGSGYSCRAAGYKE